MLTACTIVSCNYLAHARVLARSFLDAHPGSRVYALIVDRPEAGLLEEDEPFTAVAIEELDGVADLAGLLFRYTQLECNTAVKPYFLEYLMRRVGVDRLVYLDADIEVFHRFHHVDALLDDHDIVLTPHMTAPVDDGRRPAETDILLAGVYNLGFIALRDGPGTRRFLAWWQARLLDRCVVDHANGIFVDQRWIDLVPAYFERVGILKHPGYNVAYWNLHEREVVRAPGGHRVNGEPLCFFHYSGIRLDDLEGVSKYQDRFSLEDLGCVGPLFRAYRERLLEEGQAALASAPYAFSAYSDGSAISDDARRTYRELGEAREAFGDPFEAAGAGAFKAWHEALRSRWPPWMRGRRRRRPPLPEAPVVGGKERRGEGGWPPRVRVPSFLARPGVNVVGYLSTPSGMGEVARGMALALESAGVPVSRHAIELNVATRAREPAEGASAPSDFPYDVNLFCVNADQVPHLFAGAGRGVRCGRRNIGYWLWEIEDLPPRFTDAFSYFDEIWTPSAHCVHALSAHSPVPVRRVPLPVFPSAPGPGDRARFGLDPDEFVFLFAFDFLSVWERKNPIALIRAFREAFTEERVRLVLKCSNSDFERGALHELVREAGDARITMIDRTLPRSVLDDLFDSSDAYASLHRAEGFGLTVAEAMARGMPVVATGYSGVADFFDASTGWPVRYTLEPIARDAGPYPAGARWAEPDVAHAAEQLRSVYEDALDRRVRAQRGQARALDVLGIERVGRTAARHWAALRADPAPWPVESERESA